MKVNGYYSSLLIVGVREIIIPVDAFVVLHPKMTCPSKCWKKISTTLQSSFTEPRDEKSRFGRQSYWNQWYENEREFTWYAGWEDIQPFFTEVVPLEQQPPPTILLPGIGNDRSMVDMYDYGYTRLSAFDYAPEGVECAKSFFGSGGVRDDDDREVDLRVADARNLSSSYETDRFDAILEKGTLDAVYLSGGTNKELAATYLRMAVDEMSRVLRPGGIVVSITAACTDAVKDAFETTSENWNVIRDGSFYVTVDGFTSNNIDATILVYENKSN